jgi:hypothetical protein
MLLGSNSFRSDSALSPLFVDSRISQWRDMLPSRDSPAERVQAVIEKLWGGTMTGVRMPWYCSCMCCGIKRRLVMPTTSNWRSWRTNWQPFQSPADQS